MTSDGEALFRALCVNSTDDTARLVYADWLQENGQAERADFIRLQCERGTSARRTRPSPRLAQRRHACSRSMATSGTVSCRSFPA